jgi:hypothetical protein
MKFFCFNQNNSGGTYDRGDNVSEYVIVEANDAAHANDRAEAIGIYFDGVEDGRDCPCCGNRWYRMYDGEGEDVPTVYGEPVSQGDWTGQCIVHYIDGRKERY